MILMGCDPSIKLTDLDGRNATNNGFRIKIDPRTPFFAAVLAQELYEAGEKQDPVRAVLIRLDRSEQRKLEIEGHAVEVAAAVLLYGQDEASYRRAEAETMHRGYGGLFSKWTVEEIEERLRGRAAAARLWVERNMGELEKWR